MLDHGEYVGEVEKISTQFPTSVSAIYARLESLRLDGIKAENDGHAERAKALAASLQARGPEWAPLALQADFVALELRYHAIQRKFREQVVTFRITEHLGVADAMVGDRAAGAVLLVEEVRKWLGDFEVALKVADGLGLNILLAEGLYVFASCMIQETLTNDKLVPPTSELAAGRLAQINRTIERIDYACTLFEKEGAKEQWARGQLLIVEALWLRGDRADAVRKAEEIETATRREGLVDLQQRAAKIVAGESPIGPFEQLPSIFDV
jgi:hypothetical protein